MDLLRKAILVIGVVVLSALAGWIFQRLVSFKLRRIAQRTPFKWDDVLVKALKGVVFIWFLLAGMAIAMKAIALPKETAHLLQRGLSIVAIFSVVFFFARMAIGLIALRLATTPEIPTSIVKNITAVIVYLLGFLIVLDYLGISIAPLLTALGIGGLGIALALQDTVSNLFAGLYILASKKIRLGDYIKLQSGEEGFVTDITWRNVTIKALANNMIIVPNSKLASTIVTNFNLPEKEMAVLVNVGVGYDSDLQKVEEVTREVAAEILRETSGGIPEFEPFVRYHTFGDFSINFTVILRGREFVDQYLIKHEFVKRLHQRFRQAGIEIPFPVRTVFLRSKEG